MAHAKRLGVEELKSNAEVPLVVPQSEIQLSQMSIARILKELNIMSAKGRARVQALTSRPH